MTQQVINIGSVPNDGTGDPLRTAFQKSNGNFTELYTLVQGGGLVPIPNGNLLGNFSGGTALPIAVTPTQVTASLNVFTAVLNGLAPASGGGTTNYLRADGTWAQPPIPGGTGLTPIPNNQVLGNVSGAPAIPTGLASTALTALINPFTTTLSGVVPASGGGTANFLRADGTFAPSGAAILTQRGVTWSGGVGTVLTAGNVQDVTILIPQDSIITRATITTKGGPGSCQADIWVTGIGGYPPTSGNSIVGGNYPTVTSANIYDDSVLAGWSTSLPASSVVTFHLRSTSVFTEIVLMISLQRTNVTNVTGYTDGQAFSAVANSLSNSGNVKFSVGGGAISASVTGVGPFAGSLANTGYFQLPLTGGVTFMLQWGQLNTTGPGPTADFSVSFPQTFSAVYGGSANGSRNVASSGQAGNGSNFVSNLTVTGMTITVDSHASNQYTAYWLAWGKA